jgi:hypothetical protein
VGRGLFRRLEHPCDAKRREFPRQHRLRPRRADEALRREVVDLVRLTFTHRIDQRMLIEQIGGNELHLIDDVGDALVGGRRAPPNDPTTR